MQEIDQEGVGQADGWDLGNNSYEIFYGSGGHSGPYIGMQAVVKRVDQIWKSQTEYEVHVHLRHKDGLGGYWYLGSYRLKINGEKIWPKPLAEGHIGRDRVWNRKPQLASKGESITT